MEKLPRELCNAICQLLSVEDIASLRLVSRHSYEAATPFLLPEVRLIFTPKSFEKLLAISKHPIISQHVRSIYFEPDTLALKDRTLWEGSLLTKDFMDTIPDYVPPDAPPELRQAYEREVAQHPGGPTHSYTKEELDVGWAHYQRFLREQQELCRQRYGIRELQEAMRGLSKVRIFRMSMGNCLERSSDYLNKVFSPGLSGPYGDDGQAHSAGVPQLRSMLLSMHEAGIKLDTFECGDVSWKLFRCSKKDLRAFADTISLVRRFKLVISSESDGHRCGIELPQCRRFLKNGRVRDLIAQARDIKYLMVDFGWSMPVFGIELNSIFGNHIWPRLSDLMLAHVETTEDDLINFLVRHKTTLIWLRLDTIFLTSGKWTSTIPKIRSSLRLEDLLLEGVLSSKLPARVFDLGLIEWDDPFFPSDIPKIQKRDAISEWFYDGGECPFTDDWAD